MKNISYVNDEGTAIRYEDEKIGGVIVTETNNPELFATLKAKKPAAFTGAIDSRRVQIFAELDAIDLQSIRPLRAVYQNTATTEDTAKLADLESQAQVLREELSNL